MTKEGEEYIKEIEEELVDLSDKEKTEALIEKVIYWYTSAMDWCERCELEKERLTQMKEKEVSE